MTALLNLIIGVIKAIVSVCLAIIVIAGGIAIIVALFSVGAVLVPVCLVGIIGIMIYFAFNEPPP